MGDLAAVNAQGNVKGDGVSIRIHGWLCDSFSAPLSWPFFSPPPPSPATPSQEKNQGPLPGPKAGFIHSASPPALGSCGVPSFHS